MASQLEQQAGYKISRAALREKYGSRSIGYGGQSAKDTTPSGRLAYARESGMSDEKAREAVRNQFRAEVGLDNQQQIVPPSAPLLSRNGLQSRQPIKGPQYGNLASPEDVAGMVQAGGMGTVKTPWGTVTLPNTIPATDMAEYVPATASPLNGFGLPKPAPYLGAQRSSRWNKPIFG